VTSGFGPPGQRDVRPSFVVDPGMFVAAMISPNGSPRRLFQAALSGRFTLVVSPRLIAELTDVLHRDKFRARFSQRAADEMVQAIALLADHHPDPDVAGRKPVCRDPKDEYLFALAEASGATQLVSGDRDVLDTEYGPVALMSPREALDSIA
jgi:putative PIN family toxin of toxin-antitoxin system